VVHERAGSVFDFNATGLRAALTELHEWHRAAFAIACVEALIPAYERYCAMEQAGDPALVRQATDAVWQHLEPERFGQPDISLPAREALMAIMPEDEDWNEWAPQAEDTIAALVMVLDLLHDNEPELAARIATRPYASADELSARTMEVGVVGEAERRQLLESPAVQAELERQERALTALRQVARPESSVLRELRQGAHRFHIGGPDLDQQ
jgi:uncharacterized protein YjaG (DUF416 family)